MLKQKGYKKIHKILNNKKEDQILYVYRNAGKLDSEVNKYVTDCEICTKNERSKSKPVVAISRATDFNSVIAIDLKEMGKEHILWMICGFMQFIKGVVLKKQETRKYYQRIT